MSVSAVKSTLIGNSLWLLCDRAVRLLVGLMISVWIARTMGPDFFGSYAYLLAILAFAQTIVLLGTDRIAVRELAQSNIQDSGQVLGTLLTLRFSAAILATAITIGWFTLSDRDLRWPGILMSLAILTFPQDSIDHWFQSQHQSKRTVIAGLISFLVASAIRVALIVASTSLIFFAATYAVENLMLLVLMTLAWQRFRTSRPSFSATFAIKLLSESWPYLISSLAIIIYIRIDQVMLEGFLGTAAVGIYTSSTTISNLGAVVPSVIAMSLTPLMAKLHKENPEQYKTTLLTICRWYLLGGILTALSLLGLAPFLIPVLFGDVYREAIPVLQLYGFVNLFIYLGLSQGFWIINEKRPQLTLIQTLAGATAAVLLNILLIPAYGLLGAALATLLAQLISTLGVNLLLAPGLFKLQLGIRSIPT